MAVQRIEQYRQKNGVDILKVILKPTKKFPEGKNFFYAPAESLDLVNKYTWCLSSHVSRVCVLSQDNSTYKVETIYFHRKLFEFYQGYIWQGDIDHISQCEFDNTDENLNAVTCSQNQYNRYTKGYLLPNKYHSKFYPQIKLLGRVNHPMGYLKTEDEACKCQNYIEQVWLRRKLGSQYYMFDFKKYRRGSEDILDLERVGKISEEEATYRHILRYSGNAWYMLRYDLEQYYKDNHIPIPKYSLDTDGFMIHHITGQRLCPF